MIKVYQRLFDGCGVNKDQWADMQIALLPGGHAASNKIVTELSISDAILSADNFYAECVVEPPRPTPSRTDLTLSASSLPIAVGIRAASRSLYLCGPILEPWRRAVASAAAAAATPASEWGGGGVKVGGL